MTDHRISFTLTGVDRVMEGESLGELSQALIDSDRKERLEHLLESLNNSNSGSGSGSSSGGKGGKK